MTRRASHRHRASPWASLLALYALCGCAAELGAGGGVQARSGHALGFGRMAVSTKLGSPIGDHGLLLGAAVESRAEQALGARWDGGLIAGWGAGPAAIDDRAGIEVYGEFGTPLHSVLFKRGDLYAGIGVEVPLFLGSARHIADLNTSTWVIGRRIELVPLARARLQLDHPPAHRVITRLDLTAGLSLRLRFLSDLF